MPLISFGLRFRYRLLQWLYPLIRLFISPYAIPKHPKRELNLTSSANLYYVFAQSSACDMWALQRCCKKLGLPPVVLHGSACNVLILSKECLHTWMQQQNFCHEDSKPLHPILLIPIHVFWGRNPGKERSFWRLLFADHGISNFWHKLTIVLIQGRQSLVRLSKPIHFDDFVTTSTKGNSPLSANILTHKLYRLLRVHFYRQRQVAMGPAMAPRQQMVQQLLEQPLVCDAIEREAKAKKLTHAEAKQIAYRHAYEMVSDHSFFAIRFLDALLTWLWHKLYDGIEIHHAERLRHIAQDYEIIYVPSHRSHMDYLLLSYVLYYEGMMLPRIAAGINLNFWPIGSILRRTGAFFIQRTIGGNHLYATVFHEYLYLLFHARHSINFFIEGGRSRTGRLLPPKTGMLSMLLHNQQRAPHRKMAFIPVYIGYERVMEGRTYLEELQGKRKQQESAFQLLKIRHAIKRFYGKAHVSFGEPIISQSIPRSDISHDNIDRFAHRILQHIQATSTVSPTALISACLLASPHHRMSKALLAELFELCRSLLQEVCDPNALDAIDNFTTSLKHLRKLSIIRQSEDAIGFTNDETAVLQLYPRNSILHFLILPSLLAKSMLHAPEQTKEHHITLCQTLYPLLQAEWYLPWPEAQSSALLERFALLLLNQTKDMLLLLSRLFEPSMLRYLTIQSALEIHDPTQALTRTELEQTIIKKTQEALQQAGFSIWDGTDRPTIKTSISHVKHHGIDKNVCELWRLGRTNSPC